MSNRRMLKELQSLAPWQWDSNLNKNPAGPASLRDFEGVHQLYEGGASGKRSNRLCKKQETYKENYDDVDASDLAEKLHPKNGQAADAKDYQGGAPPAGKHRHKPQDRAHATKLPPTPTIHDNPIPLSTPSLHLAPQPTSRAPPTTTKPPSKRTPNSHTLPPLAASSPVSITGAIIQPPRPRSSFPPRPPRTSPASQLSTPVPSTLPLSPLSFPPTFKPVSLVRDPQPAPSPSTMNWHLTTPSVAPPPSRNNSPSDSFSFDTHPTPPDHPTPSTPSPPSLTSPDVTSNIVFLSSPPPPPLSHTLPPHPVASPQLPQIPSTSLAYPINPIDHTDPNKEPPPSALTADHNPLPFKKRHKQWSAASAPSPADSSPPTLQISPEELAVKLDEVAQAAAEQVTIPGQNDSNDTTANARVSFGGGQPGGDAPGQGSVHCGDAAFQQGQPTAPGIGIALRSAGMGRDRGPKAGQARGPGEEEGVGGDAVKQSTEVLQPAPELASTAVAYAASSGAAAATEGHPAARAPPDAATATAADPSSPAPHAAQAAASAAVGSHPPLTAPPLHPHLHPCPAPRPQATTCGALAPVPPAAATISQRTLHSAAPNPSSNPNSPRATHATITAAPSPACSPPNNPIVTITATSLGHHLSSPAPSSGPPLPAHCPAAHPPLADPSASSQAGRLLRLVTTPLPSSTSTAAAASHAALCGPLASEVNETRAAHAAAEPAALAFGALPVGSGGGVQQQQQQVKDTSEQGIQVDPQLLSILKAALLQQQQRPQAARAHLSTASAAQAATAAAATSAAAAVAAAAVACVQAAQQATPNVPQLPPSDRDPPSFPRAQVTSAAAAAAAAQLVSLQAAAATAAKAPAAKARASIRTPDAAAAAAAAKRQRLHTAPPPRRLPASAAAVHAGLLASSQQSGMLAAAPVLEILPLQMTREPGLLQAWHSGTDLQGVLQHLIPNPLLAAEAGRALERYLWDLKREGPLPGAHARLARWLDFGLGAAGAEGAEGAGRKRRRGWVGAGGV